MKATECSFKPINWTPVQMTIVQELKKGFPFSPLSVDPFLKNSYCPHYGVAFMCLS